MKAIIVVPCYNEAKRLKIELFSEFLEKNPDISILFVDDGSRDRTVEILKDFSQKHHNADIILLPKNGGKGEAVRQGILWAVDKKVPFVGFWDADLATPLDMIRPMLQKAKEGRIYISGCRLNRLGCHIRRTFFRHLLGRTFATIIANHLDLPIYDTQCGAKIFASSIAEKVFARPFVTKWFFDVEILRRITALYGRQELIEKGFEYPLDRWEEEKGSKLKYFAAFKDFLRLIFIKN